ncbi:MAG: hypothetical protein ISS15_08165 [Alphaproteobacteria bacterium]|nr:hypothetical protein [Alphaproteobacteria bacterium]MBL6936846.1 hypothetical protein [Alphaproteobacteria bacterium]MBL7097615.1 hypothetical protein [Alphaproteobacteria bacterium]
MSRLYYFNVVEGSRAFVDDEGEKFATADEAIARATALAHELMRELDTAARIVVEVVDEDGTRIAVVPGVQ